MLNTDTFDLDVQIRLLAECSVTSEPLGSRWDGVDLHFEDGGRIHTYVFEGGCVSVEYATADLAGSGHGRELADQIDLMTRNELRDLSGWDL